MQRPWSKSVRTDLWGGVGPIPNCWPTPSGSEKPITSGLFRLEAGESLEYTYTYHEIKLIVDGSFIIEDESGQKVTAKPGDLFYFPKGSAITFSTPDFGVGFFCGQRGEDEA